jgi:hypothetical protein
MFSIRHAAVAAALLGALAAPSHATLVALAADAQWNTFNVNDVDARSFGVEWIDNANTLSPDFGTPLEFAFTIAAGFKGVLTVVDAGFAGDTFKLTDFGNALGNTSGVAAQSVDSAFYIGTDFDAALTNPAFSQGVFEFSAGSYRIGGMLDQSVSLDGQPLNATVGALKLSVVAVPEPSTWLVLAAGLGALGLVSRRRR